jgi:short-subunit dehydrogenase
VTAYATSKHAVVGLSAALRAEAALHGVRVSTFCPGPVETPGLDRLPDPDLPSTITEPVTPRAYLGLISQKPVAVEAIADQALRQLARGRDLVVAPPSTRALWRLHRLSPGMTDRVLALLARRVDRAMNGGI